MAERTIPLNEISRELLLLPIGTDSYRVDVKVGRYGRLTVGRIVKMSRENGHPYLWVISGPMETKSGAILKGEAENLEAARVRLRFALDMIYRWCEEHRSGLIRWLVVDTTATKTRKSP